MLQTMKIRSLAGTLLDVPDPRKSQIMHGVQDDLSAFLNDLTMLEHAAPANGEVDHTQEEAAQIQVWADLRQRQMKLTQHGGGAVHT